MRVKGYLIYFLGCAVWWRKRQKVDTACENDGKDIDSEFFIRYSSINCRLDSSICTELHAYTYCSDDKSLGMSRLLAAFDEAKRILIFSGSGLSATSGMSTFSTKGGLYERAQRKFKLADGKNLFTYTFFDRNRTAAQAFFADIYLEATQAKPAPGHHALSDLSASGYMQRHYTLNIDGLAERVGIDTWHPDHNPNGTTVEMHGNIHFLVCVECGYQVKIDPTSLLLLQKEECIPCPECQEERTDLRFKVMMYEDAESEAITPESVMDLMEADAKAADLILWIGISFQQSASTSYFRKVRHWLQEESRLESVVQVIVNPSDESLWNLMTACSNQRRLLYWFVLVHHR